MKMRTGQASSVRFFQEIFSLLLYCGRSELTLANQAYIQYNEQVRNKLNTGFETCTEYLRGLKQQMSASREKKNRQDLSKSDWTDPKTAREAQQRKAEKRSNTVYATIAVVFVLVAAVSLVWKSQIFQKKATAAIVGGEKYTAAETSYYFNQTYQSFLNQNYYYLSYLGLDTSSDLRDQAYPGGEEGETWFDYFMDQALQQMITVKALNDHAAADGFTWTDEMQAGLDSSIASLKESVSSSGYYTSFKQYLTATYGATMTEKVFTEQAKATHLAQAYATAHSDSLTYTDAQLEETYQANPNSYDKVAYKAIRFSGAVTASTDADGNTEEVTDEMRADAMAAAKAAADSAYTAFQSGESLKALSENSENATYTDNDGVSYSADALGTWLFDSARRPGDSAVVEDSAGSAYYVVTFGERFRDEYELVNVRHILIKPEATELSEDDEGYEADVQAKKDAAKAQAEELLAQWKSGEATADAFAALAQEKSQDPGSAADGGLIPDISKDSGYVESFKNWCFEKGRKDGDTGIVESSYGYHIMYCDSHGLPYWESLVRNSLLSTDMTSWYAEMTEGYTAEQQSGVRYVG